MEVKTFKLGSNDLCITSATYLFAVYLWMKDGFLGTCVYTLTEIVTILKKRYCDPLYLWVNLCKITDF